MAAGTVTLVANLVQHEGTSICTDGTNLYYGATDHALWQLVISGGARTKLVNFNEKIVAVATDNTSVFVLLGTGRIQKVTIATSAVAELATQPIMQNVEGTSMTYYSNTLYIADKGGNIYSVTTA